MSIRRGLSEMNITKITKIRITEITEITQIRILSQNNSKNKFPTYVPKEYELPIESQEKSQKESYQEMMIGFDDSYWQK